MKTHTVTTKPVRDPYLGTRHRASCVCGWAMRLLEPRRQDAEAIGETHVAMARMREAEGGK